jgi:hypothetical protein
MGKVNDRKISNDSVFEPISDIREAKNKKNKISINIFKHKLSKSNNFKIYLRRKKNESESKFRSEGNSNLFSTNRGSVNSPKYSKLHLSGSSSFLFYSSRYNSPNRNSRSKSINIRKEKEKEKTKKISLTKMDGYSKYKIVPESKKLNEFFNAKYLKKREFIKKLTDRDLLFQKSILKLKNTPKITFEPFNKAVSQQNAEKSFTKISSLVSNRVGLQEWKENLSDEEYREYLINNRFEKTVLSSLDNRALYNYKMNVKRVQKMKEDKEILEDSSKYDKKFENIDNNNKKTLNELNNKLNRIYESELKRNNDIVNYKKEINRQIFKKLNRTRSAFDRSKIKNNFYKFISKFKYY